MILKEEQNVCTILYTRLSSCILNLMVMVVLKEMLCS